jgi:four helix bundle protein
MRIETFEDPEAWTVARRLVNRVYAATRRPIFNEDVDLRRQMRKAAMSAMANIAEGFDSGTDPEFARFLRIARRSAGELQSHGSISIDEKYLGKSEFDELYGLAREVKRLVGGLIRYLEASPRLGRRT